MRIRLLLLVLLNVGLSAAPQTASKPAQRAATWKTHCHREYGFCFKYPAAWAMLGEVFNGKGVVVAPAQKQERAEWDEVTVALVFPPPEGDEDPVSIDQAIDQAISGVRESGQSFETLERQQRRVGDKPAELVKLHYVDKPGDREWVEELVFIEGPDSEVYSVALKCAPAALPRMEPLFLHIVDSWKLSAAESGAQPEKKSLIQPAAKAESGPSKPSRPNP